MWDLVNKLGQLDNQSRALANHGFSEIVGELLGAKNEFWFNDDGFGIIGQQLSDFDLVDEHV